MAECKILLIDGSKASRAIITKAIKSRCDSASVTGYDSAASAVEQCHANDFDLIITAMSLPDMQGQEFAEKFRVECGNSSTPIIMMSGDFIQNIENQTASTHINGYFDKSKGNDHLVEYIQSYLSMRLWNKATESHVLLVEDSPTVTRVVTSMFETNGYTYLHVTNAADALSMLSHAQDITNKIKPFDIMLTDIQLEGLMSGDDLIREIRFGLGLTPDIFPILAATSANADRTEHIQNILSAGANDIIEKPLLENLLIARMSNLIHLKQCCQVK